MSQSLRKSILLVSIFLGSHTANCQISITSAHMPSANDTIRYSAVLTATGVDFKTTGENKVWDFTSLSSTSQDVYQFKNSTNTPYVINFGFSSIGLKLADSLGGGQMGLKDVYTFFKKSTTKWEAVGIGFQLGALPFPQAGKHTNTDEIYQFPLNYKDKDSATFSLKVPLTAVVVSIGNYFQDGNRVNSVDGWGKISTPYKSNVDCIRIKSVITENDSIAVAITGQAPINFAFPNNRVEYKWLSTTEKIPMLEVSGTQIGNTFTPTQIRYRDNYKTTTNGNVSIKPTINSQLTAYPNPARNTVTIEVPGFIKNSLKLLVFDMEGKNIESLNFEAFENQIILNTSNFADGKYTAIVTNGNIFNYTSITIIK
jgi:hypothetical protein